MRAAIKPSDIEFFLDIAFGKDDGVLLGFGRTARVKSSGAPTTVYDSLAWAAIDEVNGLVGRQMLVRGDSAPDVELRFVNPATFSDVDFTRRKSWSETNLEWDGSGRIAHGVILVSDGMKSISLNAALRLNLARALGLYYGSTRTARTIFYERESINGAQGFEPVDRAALRILGENPELIGMTRAQVRKYLFEKYPR